MDEHRREVTVGILDNDALVLQTILDKVTYCSTADIHYRVWAETSIIQAIQRCPSDHTDIILLDMGLSGISGVKVAYELRRRHPQLGIIGITSYPQETFLRPLQKVGAQALLDKALLDKQLAPALSAAANGHAWPADGGFADVGQSCDGSAISPAMELTPTQASIVALSAGNLSAKEIARRLQVKPQTIYSHRNQIMSKLNCATWQEVIDECQAIHII